MTRTADNQVQVFDEQGTLIGTIVRPVTAEVLGRGAEKVYLAKHPAETARSAQRPVPHAA